MGGLVWYYTVVSPVRVHVDKLHDWVRRSACSIGARKGATDAGNNENKPEAFAVLVHVWPIDDTKTMCEPSLVMAS